MLVLSGIGSATDREQADMSLFQRAHDIVAAKADKALDNADRWVGERACSRAT
jgi:hypothetical protein